MGEEKVQEQIIQFFAGFHATRAISLGISIGLFEEINRHNEGISCDLLASNLKISREPLGELCSLCCKLALISNENEKFKIAPKTAQIISEAGGHAAYCMATAQEFGEYGAVLKTGQPLEVINRSEYYTHAVSLALKRTYEFLAKTILPRVKGASGILDKGASCLEIGCGEGQCIANLAKLYPKSRFTGIDISEKAVKNAREFIKKEHLEDRVTFSHNPDIALEDTFDFAYTLSSLHEFKEPAKILENYQKYLRKGGILLVADFTKPTENSRPASALEQVLHGLFFDEVMQGTPYLDNKRILEIIEKAGYRSIEPINTEPLTYIAAYSCMRGETDGR